MYYETIQIDFNSDEAIYIQLRNQIILGIATSRIQEGLMKFVDSNWIPTFCLFRLLVAVRVICIANLKISLF